MIIKKTPENKFVLSYDKTAKVYLDPNRVEAGVNILTDWERNINDGRIFNLTGQYEAGNFYFQAFLQSKLKSAEAKKLFFIIRDNEGLNYLYCPTDISDAVLKEISLEFEKIDAVLFKELSAGSISKIKSYFKPLVWIGFSDRSRALDLKREKTNEVKINSKKIAPAFYLMH